MEIMHVIQTGLRITDINSNQQFIIQHDKVLMSGTIAFLRTCLNIIMLL
jgi:hypothetical protein